MVKLSRQSGLGTILNGRWSYELGSLPWCSSRARPKTFITLFGDPNQLRVYTKYPEATSFAQKTWKALGSALFLRANRTVRWAMQILVGSGNILRSREPKAIFSNK